MILSLSRGTESGPPSFQYSTGRQRAHEHPADVILMFRRQVAAAVGLTKRDGYEQAASLLTEMSACYERLGATGEFAEYVRRLRAAHRRKCNFIATFDAARLPG